MLTFHLFTSLQLLLGHLPLKLALVCLLASRFVSCLENPDISYDYDYDYDNENADLQKEWEQGEVRMRHDFFRRSHVSSPPWGTL